MIRVIRICGSWKHGLRKCIRQQSTSCKPTVRNSSDESLLPRPEFYWSFMTDPENVKIMEHNIASRKGVGDPQLVCDLYRKWTATGEKHVEDELYAAAAAIPNLSHPMSPLGPKEREVKLVGKKPENKSAKSLGQLGDYLRILRTENMGHSSGHKSYYFIDALAHLEAALVQYTVDVLAKKGLTLISVPNIVHPSVVEGCGFKVTSDENRTQVYKLDPAHYGEACLAGTGEIPLSGFFMNRVLEEKDLPQMVATVSHCYRAEAPNADIDKALYRVHQFTKVEMFGVCSAEMGRSEELFQKIVDIQQELFEPLGIHFRVLDMPRGDLGAPAYRKYDMEAWMAAKGFWGEISSASNCTDFQSRRLNIKYRDREGEVRHAHTVNGTACAVPRLLMALLETHQQQDDGILIPEVLQPYMPDAQTHIYRTPSNIANLRWIRSFARLKAKG